MPKLTVASQVEGHEAQVIARSVGHKLREPLVIQYNEWKGRPRVSIRFHYHDAERLLPGRRGCEFAVSMLDDVIAALQAVKEELEG